MFKYGVIYKDKEGNTISLDWWDNKIAVRNRKGQLVNPVDSLAILKRPIIKKAVAKYFKAQGYTDVEASLTLLKEKARKAKLKKN